MQRLLGLSFFALSILILANSQVVLADSGESMRGWSWGGSEESADATINGNETGLGWLSLNSMNCDPDEDGQSEGAADCPPSGSPVADYGVHVPQTDGDLNGYAWSENLGWVSFQSADLGGCPSAPCAARREGDEIHGWARVVNIPAAGSNAGGYGGWIKLHSESGDAVSYGWDIDTVPSPDEVNGYIWSSEFGWIDAKTVTVTDNNSMIICPSAATITIGGTLNLRAYYNPTRRIFSCADLTDAATIEITADAGTSWSSTDTGIFTVDNGASKGLITGVAAGGPLNVNVQYNGNSAAGIVIVNGTVASCGDGVVGAGETCDDGAAGNGSCADGYTCSASCVVNICHCSP